MQKLLHLVSEKIVSDFGSPRIRLRDQTFGDRVFLVWEVKFHFLESTFVQIREEEIGY